MKSFLVCLMLLVVSACATTPPLDTVNKRMAAFEITYQETLKTAISLREQGLLDEDQVKSVDTLVNNIETARTSAYTAISLGNVDLAEDKLRVAQTALVALSEILKQKAAPNAKCDYCNRFVNSIT